MFFDTLLVTLIGRLFCTSRPKLISTLSGKLSGMLSPEVSGGLLGPFSAQLIGPLSAPPLVAFQQRLDFLRIRVRSLSLLASGF
jgi:hypothetical protein